MSAVARSITTIDYHTAGEPFRIAEEGFAPILGATVAEKRIYAQNSNEIDDVRTMLCREPRGHADMYGAFIVEPDDDGADFGVLFWHNDGYSTACGHGTIALGAWAVQSGRVQSDREGVTAINIDVPSGRVVAHVQRVAGVVVGVAFENVASYPVQRSISVDTSFGRVSVDVAFAGALYASIDAAQLGLEVVRQHTSALRAIGREIKWALNDTEVAHHPSDPRLSGIYGTIIFDDLGETPEGVHQRNVTVFADGRIDRSPCGSGTAARLALLANEGRIDDGGALIHDSIIGTRFTGRYRPAANHEIPGAIIATVEGMAYETGRSRFTLDPADPLGPGFELT
ncbi:MAG: proline racemase family protein [Acidobacteria bacterium]|nr:proline racemase family protein [Acidobacteriota bacterium]